VSQPSAARARVVHPPARNLPAKVSAFRDLVVEALAIG